MSSSKEINRGLRTRNLWMPPDFPSADEAFSSGDQARSHGVDLLLVNPPGPDRGIWIRSQHRVGRRSREGMVWPQADLAQLAALFPDFSVEIVDAIAQRMSWESFQELLRAKRPRFYVTQVSAPTLQNDMYGVFLAKALGATTVAFGTHVTPMPQSTMEDYAALDFVIRGEPELTLRELVDKTGSLTLGSSSANADPWCDLPPGLRERLLKMFQDSDAQWLPPKPADNHVSVNHERLLAEIKGLVWRRCGTITMNQDRPLIKHLDDLPLPRHDLLPLSSYRAPLVRGPYAFVVTSRGCPGGCRFCIKHVSYGQSVRFRSAENVADEVEALSRLGVRSIHMYADLFTVNRDQVMGICHQLLERGLQIRWTCNSRVDFVDPEMLDLMARSGCWMISWGIESGDERMLKRMRKGTTSAMVTQAIEWSRLAGIKNWGYFIIGLPGETEATIRKTIDLAKELPLDLALFHIAAPHPGTPFFFEVMENGWFRADARWEEVDMDRSTVLDYPQLRAEDLERWGRRAFREWALRPRPFVTFLRMLASSPSLVRSALTIGVESLGWARWR